MGHGDCSWCSGNAQAPAALVVRSAWYQRRETLADPRAANCGGCCAIIPMPVGECVSEGIFLWYLCSFGGQGCVVIAVEEEDGEMEDVGDAINGL